MFLNKCCSVCENVCKLFFFTLCLLHMVECLWWFPFCPNFRNIFDVETYECALAENRNETGDIDKNRYNFYMIFLLIDTWHIVFIYFLNDCSWCELSDIYGVHTVESLEMIYFVAWNIAILLIRNSQAMVVRDHMTMKSKRTPNSGNT